MNDIHQLIKQEGTQYGNVFPKAYVQGITDKNSGKTLDEILSNFNMYFLSYDGDIKNTRLQVPLNIRKKGLWVTYINLKGNVVTEWYNNNSVEDKDWENSDNWIDGSNMLSGDLAISSEGYWVINGVNTKLPARGKEGITPLLRGFNGKLQVSYNNGESFNYLDLPTFVKEDNEDIKAIIDSNGIKELKFADKAYNPAEFSGLGRVILRKNIIQGKNVLTQEMINKPNTIYVIRYDFDLNGATINVPENCTLDFQGGSLKDGTLNGNNTLLVSFPYHIFYNIKLKNRFNIENLYVEWFGVKPNINIDNSQVINVAISNAVNINKPLLFTNESYYINNPIILKTKIILKGIYSIEKNPQIIYTGSTECFEIEDERHISIISLSIIRYNYNNHPYNDIDNAPNCFNFKKGIYRVYIDNCHFIGFNYVFFCNPVKGEGMSYNTIKNSTFRRCNISLYYKGYYEGSNSLESYCTYTTIDNCIFSGLKRGAIYIEVHSNLDVVNITNSNFEYIGYNKYYSDDVENIFCIIAKSRKNKNTKLNIDNCYFENIYHYNNSVISNYDYDLNYLLGIENISLTLTNTTCINCINLVKSFGEDIITINNCSTDGNIINKQFNVCIPNLDNTILNINNFIAYVDNVDIINKPIINNEGKLSIKAINILIFNMPSYTINNLYLAKQDKRYNTLQLFVSSIKDNIENNSGLLFHRPIDLKKINIPLLNLELYITDTMIFSSDKMIRNCNSLYIHDGIININSPIKLSIIDKIIFYNLNVINQEINAMFKLYKYAQRTNCEIIYKDVTFKGDKNIYLFEGEDKSVMFSDYAKLIMDNVKKEGNIKIYPYINNDFRIPVAIWIGDNNIEKDNIILSSGVPTSKKPPIVVEGESFIDKNNIPIWKVGNKFINADGNPNDILKKGTTAQRPTGVQIGFTYKDTDLNKWIIWNGEAWENIDGTALV